MNHMCMLFPIHCLYFPLKKVTVNVVFYVCFYQHNREEGVRVLRDENQDNNDFEKCLEELKCYTNLKHCNNNAIIKENCMRYGEDLLACDKHVVSTSFGSNMVILAIGGFHNSLHHDMGNLHVLYKYMDIQSPVFHRMVLIGEKCLAELMSVAQGPKHNIQPIVGIEGPTCGLLPLRKPCQTVTTTGLKWDLSEHTLEFGDLISTSNEFTIPHDGPPLITMELSDTLLWTCDYVL